MRYIIIALVILNFVNCEADPLRDKKRNTDKYKLAAILGHNSETKSTVQVNQETYEKYNISDSYSGGTISYKYIEKKFYYFVISKITKDSL
jgi:hypothetical protein